MIYILSISVIISFFIHWFLIPVRRRNLFLLICSLFFIASFSISHAIFFVFNVILVYIAATFIKREYKNKKTLLKLTLIWLIGNLCFFKCTNLLLHTIFKVGFRPYLFAQIEFPNILLPLGLSYITFRLIHYIIEIYRNNAPKGSLIDFALYILFFPTFLVGPVERFQRFYPQTMDKKGIDVLNINYGLFRIICGIIKKVFIADNLARILMPVFVSPQAHSRLILICSIYGLAIQIYMDFSGYTDIALGIARLFGYKIMENFNKPLFQKNIALFWRNYHISMYSWVRDYFFFPIFGSRASIFKLYLGIFLSLIVFQLWHTVSMGFLILGVYHGTGLIIWQLFQELKKRQPVIKNLFSHKWLNPVSVLFTFIFVGFSSVFFNANIQDILRIIKRIIM